MHPYLVRAAPARHVSAAVVRVADHAAAVAVVTFLSLAAALVVLGGLARVARAQLVTPKTLPVFQNQQFDILPSATAGMGGLSIALDDSLADPFVNPAKATRLRGGTFFTAPFRHSVSNNRGGGRTLPVGGMGSFGNWSVAGVFALQQLDRAGQMSFTPAISDRTATNQYLTLSAARRVGHGVSVGVSGTFAELNAVDGVDLLYQGSDRINQAGSSSDVRLGFTKEFAPHQALEVVLLHNLYQMTHDVHYTNSRWDPVARQSFTTQRTDHNVDRTSIWGAHAEYTQPIGSEGWHIGWLGTVNQLSHPKIPEYVLESVRPIPRDPGSTLAFNAGIGLSKVWSGSTFGIDLVREPMTSNTWADAARDTAVAGGGTIRAGGKTIENSFRFNNTVLRMGFGHDVAVGTDSNSVFGFQLGLGLYAINYKLDQTNNVLKTSRTQKESWMEWTPTLGLAYRTHSMQLRYNYSVTCAVSECFSFGMGDRVTVAGPASSGGDTTGGVIVAPSSALTFNGGTASSHKFWISIPIK